jgi:hypothetical protein
VVERAQLGRDPCNVLVHVMGLRPGERRNQADTHGRGRV